MEESRARKVSGKTLVIIGGACIAGLLTMGYFGFGELGRHRFAQGSLITEAHMNVAMLARGVASCAEAPNPKNGGIAPRALPPSTAFVPAETRALRAGYTSTPSDWNGPTFTCAKFSITEPQRFQYRWELTGPARGVAEAQADLDGDGTPEVFLHVVVTCAGAEASFKCEIGSVEPLPWPDAGASATGS